MITDYEVVARTTTLDFADLLKRFTIEINEGRDQFGIRCNHCGYQFIQSWRERPGHPGPPPGAEYGEMNLVAIVGMAIEHDRPGHGTESCERYDNPATGKPDGTPIWPSTPWPDRTPEPEHFDQITDEAFDGPDHPRHTNPTAVSWSGAATDYWENAEAINHDIVQALIAQTDAETPDTDAETP